MSEPEESPAAPDSTTKEQRLGFSHGEDVLLQHKDGKYYLGTVVEVDLVRERCLVKFLDNTSSWSSVKELAKLAMPESDVMCVLCKKSQPKTDNDIIVCDKCGRGYHQLCHQPQITKEETLPEAHWMCKRCIDSQPRSREPPEPKNSMVKANIRKVCSGRDQPQPPPDDMTKLPYDPEMLSWDAHHRVNAEQIYCYCGLNGEWYTQMLQCARCKQWFHEKCVSCLTCPLYSGDRFYVFVCSMCNYGKEFVRRLELKWVDLVHLMLYNLTVYNAKKYYDLDTIIVPYANENWNALQLPPRIRDVSAQVRRDSILAILTNNRNRFKCGREIKKRTTIWGLRVRLPPPCPVVNLPATGNIDDSVLRRCWGANKRLQYLPPPTNADCPLPAAKSQGVKDARYKKARKLLKNAIAKSKSRSPEASELPPTPPTSVSGPPTPPATTSGMSELSVPSSLDLMNTLPLSTPVDTSGDETSSRGTLDSFIPPPKDFEGKNNPFRNLNDLLGTPCGIGQGSSSTPLSNNNCPITLPLPLTPVIPQPPIVRPAKRQLSEKDIIIDRNGQVKRRRQHRRGRPPHQPQFQPTAIKTAAILPARNNEVKSEFVRNLRSSFNNSSSSSNSQIGNCVDYALNGRRLRQRQSNEKLPPPDPQPQKKGSVPSSPKCSPVKQNAPDISMDDLKSSVNIYFGAANRIAAGEKFFIRAKRIGSNGQTQYLIEWEGPTT
ncbi:metal-response element-binding transcription factor 2 isoform X1 [Athalia rosae]|uniref:metal-response element-binding transcription factor 2 isoform X1 n=1 Tax=Athalia rosae TaxID=37344 RepID=UPI0006251FC0|nr:metal-response element-binding transcription factor 2 isoform X1 [Athalia rosae]XP_012253950.1 metal-response element-binding transcription factor 2 isoform X1 [Athalia rosae]